MPFILKSMPGNTALYIEKYKKIVEYIFYLLPAYDLYHNLPPSLAYTTKRALKRRTFSQVLLVPNVRVPSIRENQGKNSLGKSGNLVESQGKSGKFALTELNQP